MQDDERRKDEPLLEGMGQLPDRVFHFPLPRSELRSELLRRTSRIVRRRHRRGQALALGGVFLIYLAGAGTGYLLGWSGRDQETRPAGAPTIAAASDEMRLPPDPRDLERELVMVEPGRREKLLRQAGNGYLSPDRADPAAALYCYRRLLDNMPPSEKESPQPDDSWLLVYLKLARQ